MAGDSEADAKRYGALDEDLILESESQLFHEHAALVRRVSELEAALDDAYAFVCVYADRYRRDAGMDTLHEKHAEIADRIARLLGKENMPSVVLANKL